MILPLAVVLAFAAPGDSCRLQGAVRATGSGDAVPGALIEVVDGHRGAWSDSAGDYRLDLSQGTHRLRVWHPGYDARTLEVLVGTDSVMRLDISLTPHPVLLGEVSVVGRKDGEAAAAGPGVWIGSRSYTSERLHNDPASDGADVLGTVATAPGVAVAPEMPAGLHVRGGSADQNLVLVDGVPLYNPDHAGGALGALNPDALGSVTVHAGVAPPRFGDALSGVVALETGEPSRTGIESRGAAGALTVGETVSGKLPGAPGTFLVSGRHSTADLIGAREPSEGAASFGDLLARADVDIGRGGLEIFALASSDHLGFDSRPATGAGTGTTAVPDSTAAAATPSADSALSWNSFRWSTSTQAAVWRSDRVAPARLEVRAWRTRFDAGAAWAADSGPVRLVNALSRDGLSADASWRPWSGLAAAGVAAERIGTRYALSRLAAGAAAGPDSALAVLGSSAVLVSGYVQGQFNVGTRWAVALGARARIVTGRSRALEPRASVRFAAFPWLALSAGYGRMHQTVQSLRNEESALDPLVGIALPAAAGSHGIPRAHGDQLALAAEVRLDARTRLTLDAYRRALGGLLLVAPATAQPFVMQRFACGAGRASGATLLLEHDGARLFGHAAWALAASSRDVAAHRYHPSFGGAQSLTAAAGWRLGPATTLRAAWWSTAGRPTSEVEGDLQWVPYNLLRGAGAFSGSPQRIAGAVGGSGLPAYERLDLGVRRQWHGRLLGRAAGLVTSLTLRNALGRANALGIVLPDDAHTVRAIPMLPRTLTAELEWTY